MKSTCAWSSLGVVLSFTGSPWREPNTPAWEGGQGAYQQSPKSLSSRINIPKSWPEPEDVGPMGVGF